MEQITFKAEICDFQPANLSSYIRVSQVNFGLKLKIYSRRPQFSATFFFFFGYLSEEFLFLFYLYSVLITGPYL